MSEDEEIIQSGPDAGKTVAELRKEVFDPAVSDYEYFERRMAAHGLNRPALPNKWGERKPDELIFDEKLEHDEAVGSMEEWQRQFQGMPCEHFAGRQTETGRPKKWEPPEIADEQEFGKGITLGLQAGHPQVTPKPSYGYSYPFVSTGEEEAPTDEELMAGVMVPMGLGKSGQMRIGGNMPEITRLAKADPDDHASEAARRFLLRYGHDDPAGVTENQRLDYLRSLAAGEIVVETETSALHRCQGVVYFNPDHPGSPCVKWETDQGPMGTSVTGGARRLDDLPWWPTTPTVERKPFFHPALGAPYGRGSKLGGSFHAMAMMMALGGMGGGFPMFGEERRPRFHDKPADPIGRIIIDKEAEERKRAERRQRKADKKMLKRVQPLPKEIKEFKNSQRKRKK